MEEGSGSGSSSGGGMGAARGSISLYSSGKLSPTGFIPDVFSWRQGGEERLIWVIAKTNSGAKKGSEEQLGRFETIIIL